MGEGRGQPGQGRGGGGYHTGRRWEERAGQSGLGAAPGRSGPPQQGQGQPSQGTGCIMPPCQLGHHLGPAVCGCLVRRLVGTAGTCSAGPHPCAFPSAASCTHYCTRMPRRSLLTHPLGPLPTTSPPAPLPPCPVAAPRPHIFGMTAAPANVRRRQGQAAMEGRIRELEANLDAKGGRGGEEVEQGGGATWAGVCESSMWCLGARPGYAGAAVHPPSTANAVNAPARRLQRPSQ